MTKVALGVSLGLALFLGTASSALAAPVPCPSSGTPSYADLMATNAGGGCFIADQVFSAFTFLGTSSGTTPPAPLTASQMSYTLDNTPPTLMGFEFAMALAAAGNGVNDITISYNVSAANVLHPLTSVHNLLTGAASGGGSITVAEDYCLGALDFFGCSASGQLQTNATSPHQDVFFAGVSMLSVIKDISAAGDGGFASISAVRDAVDEDPPPPPVPAPATLSYVLGGLGLLALRLLRRESTQRGGFAL